MWVYVRILNENLIVIYDELGQKLFVNFLNNFVKFMIFIMMSFVI